LYLAKVLLVVVEGRKVTGEIDTTEAEAFSLILVTGCKGLAGGGGWEEATVEIDMIKAKSFFYKPNYIVTRTSLCWWRGRRRHWR